MVMGFLSGYLSFSDGVYSQFYGDPIRAMDRNHPHARGDNAQYASAPSSRLAIYQIAPVLQLHNWNSLGYSGNVAVNMG